VHIYPPPLPLRRRVTLLALRHESILCWKSKQYRQAHSLPQS